jgi:hypothetical protein
LRRNVTEKKTTRDPEDLTSEERRAILQRSYERRRRDFENELIARELEREAQEEATRRTAS